VGQVVLLSFTSAFNPTLLTTTTVMLLLPNPGRLMIGYWLGAMFTSITLGLVIVLTLGGSSGTTTTTQNTLSPVVDIALGAILLVAARVLAKARLPRRKESKGPKEPPRWQRTLSKGSAKTTFVVGCLLTLPGASYLAGLHRLGKLGYSTTTEVLVVIGFNLVMLVLLELPMLAFALAPQRAAQDIERAKAWARAHGRTYGSRALAILGVALVVKGIVGLLS
jgi:hypothetical protein